MVLKSSEKVLVQGQLLLFSPWISGVHKMCAYSQSMPEGLQWVSMLQLTVTYIFIWVNES